MSKYRDWKDLIKFRQQLAADAVRDGMRYDEVAAALNMHADQVRAWCYQLGVKLTDDAKKRPRLKPSEPRARVLYPTDPKQVAKGR